MAQKIIGAQRDFTYGEVDVSFKRNDEHPARKAGLRQMSNMRILDTAGIQSRSGRSALFPASGAGRIEKVTMSAGSDFTLAFGFAAGTGTIVIRDAAGAAVATFTTRGSGAILPWTLATLDQIVYAQKGMQIFLTYPSMRPQVLTWNGVSTWVIADYVEAVYGNQKRTPFYRLSPAGVTLVPSGTTGSVTLTASSPIFTAAHIGTRLRWVGRQLLITAVTTPPSFTATATVQETLNTTLEIHSTVDPRTQLSVGDVVLGATTGAKGIVSSLTSTRVRVILTTGVLFASGSDRNEDVVGPAGIVHIIAADTIIIASEPTILWDDEVINDLRGYPASCFVDQFRLGFCNFPAIPGGVAWSAINTPDDLYVGTNPANAIFEVAPDKVQVYFVAPGAESSEFVFCDSKLYYIKIDVTNPLKPGSVSFQVLSGDGCARVQPRLSQEVLLYVNAGGSNVMAIVAAGAFYRPFNTRILTAFHGHLFSNIKAIAVPNADGSFTERYAYVMNGDGSVVVGKYTLQDGQFAPAIGWGPWSGVGSTQWVSAWHSDVLFTSSYFGTVICEVLDDAQYLDAALSVNSLPAAFAAPVGKGPLWWIPSQSVTLIDQGTRFMGTYQIDIDGFIVPQGLGGENLLAASLIAGQPYNSTIEPFCPNAAPGVDAGQRMKMRQITNFIAYVIHSSGFVMGGLFSGAHTRTSPPPGTLMNQRRFQAWNQDDDPTLPPPERETAESHPPPGNSFDPRAVIIKDTPGPLQLLELAVEVSI